MSEQPMIQKRRFWENGSRIYNESEGAMTSFYEEGHTSGLSLLKSKKEPITQVPLKYDEGKAQIQIQELCNTVCSQYSEEYLQLKKGTEPVDNARVQKAQAEFVTCHLKCSLSIKAQLKSLQ
ncbi:hypothetical protein T02_6036 [Trichinella nativa]|uniref:Uncharacterized protein n=1 Tax=Trichinella nativa TaxID=6335 RepID=A0A0V1LKS9_9BILA|nr:hypothetical protein T02_6036 [Trichinella nativa]